MTIVWQKVSGSEDYTWGDYIAVHKGSSGRLMGPSYWVFHKTETRRTMRNALCVGGLPTMLRQLGLTKAV